MNDYDWGDTLDAPSKLPVAGDPAPVEGERLPNGNLRCGGCHLEIPDNSSPALKPSCPNCWAAVDVKEPVPGLPPVDSGGGHPFMGPFRLRPWQLSATRRQDGGSHVF